MKTIEKLEEDFFQRDDAEIILNISALFDEVWSLRKKVSELIESNNELVTQLKK